jgi:hypothetical protein
MDIRVIKVSDIPHVQQANITNLPENYFCKYYMYHALTWPQLSYVAVDVRLTTLPTTTMTLLLPTTTYPSGHMSMEHKMNMGQTSIRKQSG